jgi:hypothetical protein
VSILRASDANPSLSFDAQLEARITPAALFIFFSNQNTDAETL